LSRRIARIVLMTSKMSDGVLLCGRIAASVCEVARRIQRNDKIAEEQASRSTLWTTTTSVRSDPSLETGRGGPRVRRLVAGGRGFEPVVARTGCPSAHSTGQPPSLFV